MSERTLDLATPGACALLASWIKQDIDAYCVKTYDSGHRSHLGASVIGHECSRYLWYVFRWVKGDEFDARMLRLFERGNFEEARFIEYLRGIGFDIQGIDDATGNQHRVVACNGHFGGSFDAHGVSPSRYNVGEKLLCEFKTKATGKGFADLKEKGVILTNHQHYAQMCVYGRLHDLKFAIYMCVNKNDDDLHVEVVPLDWGLGDELIKRAEYIITSPTAPPRISEERTYFKCRYCPFIEICFDHKPVEHNCRSCKNAFPVDNGQWACKKWNAVIPNKEAILAGCPSHEPITDIPL